MRARITLMQQEDQLIVRKE